MLATLLTFAAEAAGEETSHTPFYLLGGLLVAWAVVVSALGIARDESFPAGNGARNAIIGITALLVAAVCASSVLTA